LTGNPEVLFFDANYQNNNEHSNVPLISEDLKAAGMMSAAALIIFPSTCQISIK